MGLGWSIVNLNVGSCILGDLRDMAMGHSDKKQAMEKHQAAGPHVNSGPMDSHTLFHQKV